MIANCVIFLCVEEECTNLSYIICLFILGSYHYFYLLTAKVNNAKANTVTYSLLFSSSKKLFFRMYSVLGLTVNVSTRHAATVDRSRHRWLVMRACLNTKAIFSHLPFSN